MEAQSHDGLTLLLTLAGVCILIFASAFYLTFYRKVDTSDKH
jgi:hypothetical protein